MKKSTRRWERVGWARFREDFLKFHLRHVSVRWPAKNIARQAARSERKLNPDTDRLCWYGRCAAPGCGAEMREGDLEMDHIEPVVPVHRDRSEAAYSANRVGALLERMFPEPSGYQALCPSCHVQKTFREGQERAEDRRAWKRTLQEGEKL